MLSESPLFSFTVGIKINVRVINIKNRLTLDKPLPVNCHISCFKHAPTLIFQSENLFVPEAGEPGLRLERSDVRHLNSGCGPPRLHIPAGSDAKVTCESDKSHVSYKHRRGWSNVAGLQTM